MKIIRILGDFVLSSPTHMATNRALEASINALDANIETQWVRTDQISEHTVVDSDGFWVAPGSPYQDLGKVLNAIKFAREHQVPMLGTCGGFQHMALEYAQHLLNMPDAVHAEYDPNAAEPFIYKLPVSLAGQTLEIDLLPGSRIESLYGRQQVTEAYFCSFGVNPAFGKVLEDGPMRFTAWDNQGEYRSLELPGHPFFMGLLFVPGATSTDPHPHPVVSGFVRAVTEA